MVPELVADIAARLKTWTFEGALSLDVAMLGSSSQRSSGPNKAADSTLSIRLAGASIVVGPLDTGAGPCATCLDYRWLALKSPEEQHLLKQWQKGVTYSDAEYESMPLPHSQRDAIWIVITQLLRRTTEGDRREGEIFVLDLLSRAVKRYEVVPVSACPTCGIPRGDCAADAVVELETRPKGSEQSVRLRSLESYSFAESTYLNPLCGVLGPGAVREYGNRITASARGDFNTPGGSGLWWGGHTQTYRESVRNGILEGLERSAGLMPASKAVTVRNTLHNLGETALDPRACGTYDDAIYERPAYRAVPFTKDLEIDWVWGYSLTRRRSVLVPKQMVYLWDHTRPELSFVQTSSSGCATGSCIEEAILFGLLELIERDAFMISWFARLPLRRIDIAAVRDRDLTFTCDRLNYAGYDLDLFDTRLDLHVPSVMAVATRRDTGLGHLIVGAGAHFDPVSAMRSAVAEIGGAALGFPRRTSANLETLERMADDFTLVTRLQDHAALYGIPAMAEHAGFMWEGAPPASPDHLYQDWEEHRPRTLDLREDVAYLIDRLAVASLGEVIVVDQTSREQAAMGLRTACVVVPGLVPIDFGYFRRRYLSLARTYTAPVTAGYRLTALAASDINPAPHPFP